MVAAFTLLGSGCGSTRPAKTADPAASAAPQAERVQPALGPAGGPVPRGFRAQSVTFVSPTMGWVLGTAPCAAAPCTSVLRTRDGGRTWSGIPAPRVRLGDGLPAEGASELRFADARNGSGSERVSRPWRQSGVTRWRSSGLGARCGSCAPPRTAMTGARPPACECRAPSSSRSRIWPSRAPRYGSSPARPRST
jgi:hypothetical protein